MTLSLQGLPPEKLDELAGATRKEPDASRVSISVPNRRKKSGRAVRKTYAAAG